MKHLEFTAKFEDGSKEVFRKTVGDEKHAPLLAVRDQYPDRSWAHQRNIWEPVTLVNKHGVRASVSWIEVVEPPVPQVKRRIVTENQAGYSSVTFYAADVVLLKRIAKVAEPYAKSVFLWEDRKSVDVFVLPNFDKDEVIRFLESTL